MPDIALRGELWDNDSADVLRFWGWRDITAPMDIQAALEAAGGEDVTLLVNSPGGDMAVGLEIRSMLRRYQGRTTALFQGFGASVAARASRGPCCATTIPAVGPKGTTGPCAGPRRACATPGTASWRFTPPGAGPGAGRS